MANWICRGMILLFLLSLLAFPASSSTCKKKHNTKHESKEKKQYTHWDPSCTSQGETRKMSAASKPKPRLKTEKHATTQNTGKQENLPLRLGTPRQRPSTPELRLQHAAHSDLSSSSELACSQETEAQP
jgi:hypothetical protein